MPDAFPALERGRLDRPRKALGPDATRAVTNVHRAQRGQRQTRTELAAARLAGVAEAAAPGDRLGSKDELRVLCGVSVGTFNEAVRLLQARGMVTLRPGPGGGLFAAEQSPMVRLGNSVLALDGDPSSVADAVRIRDALDPLMIEEALWHLQAFDLSPIGPMRRREIAEEDWAHGWKEHFHPLRIGRVVIKPSWRGWDEQPDELVIELDPGMAFGTGLHPTTKLMIEALQERVKPGMQVLDLGTGSGILAIPAAMLGAEVTGLDVSEVAVQVARDNVAANGLTDHISMEQGSIEGAAGQQFDLILANITASVLIDLAEKLVDALRPGAELLASGIIDERVEQVRAAFRDAGLQIAGGKQDGDWWLVVARRTA